MKPIDNTIEVPRGKLAVKVIAMPKDTNPDGDIFGGWILSNMDSAAALIARDQNNKATATITRARQEDLGITHAYWIHSNGGKKPRPSHVKAGQEKTVYEVSKGWFDPDEGEYIWPGMLINCRCVCKAILPSQAIRLGLVKPTPEQAKALGISQDLS